VGHTFLIHTGKDFKKLVVTDELVGHRLGEFAPTRRRKPTKRKNKK
jgi:small subunit ribosomal protein S19